MKYENTYLCNMEIKFSNISNRLGTRVIAQDVRHTVEKAFEENQRVVFNLENVQSMSHSFADECFAKLLLTWELDEIKKKSTFINVTSDVKSIIKFVINEQLSSTIS